MSESIYLSSDLRFAYLREPLHPWWLGILPCELSHSVALTDYHKRNEVTRRYADKTNYREGERSGSEPTLELAVGAAATEEPRDEGDTEDDVEDREACTALPELRAAGVSVVIALSGLSRCS